MNASRRDPLRIAMVSANSLPYIGGVETHIDEVAKRLSTSNVEVTLLTTDRSGTYPREEDFGGYRVRRWRAYPRTRDYYFSPGLARHLHPERYDVVHVQGVHTLVAPTALAIARRARVPSVLTFHTGGHSSGARSSLRPLQWRVLSPLLRSTAALVAVSEFERRSFASTLRVPEQSIRLIRNGSDPLPIDRSWQSPEGSPLLVSVGRLERYKGHHRILAALPSILRQAPNARLMVVGSGPYEESLREQARQLRVDHRFSICGFGPEQRAQMGKLIADADLMCLLSEYEAHPVAVMEAVAAGTNALVADTSGLSELGHAGLATTIPLDASPDEVATAALVVAAKHRTSPAAISSWDECAEQLLRLYGEVA